MKRKDYDLIAKVIKGLPKGAIRADVCSRFVNTLMKDNSNFNVDEFITACGL